MKDNLIHYRTSVCNINYHIVWSVKYRKKVLSEDVEKCLKQVIFNTALCRGFTVHLIECGNCDHVHCFISAPPTICVSEIVKALKGVSGRKLFESFPALRKQLWKGSLWNPSYYCETIGSVSEENIKKYIEHQCKS